MKAITTNNQSGAVSIFIVIFSALLVTIVTISFVSVMVRNQQQASNADLSSSAYDSALAGVEDAKRLLLIHRVCQRNGDTGTECQRIAALITSQQCNTVKEGLYPASADDEVIIQRQLGETASEELNQAYTCVKINYLSGDMKGTLADGESQLLALETGGGQTFDKIKVSWFKRAQTSSEPLGSVPSAITTPTPLFPTKSEVNWPVTAAPVLRTQYIQMARPFDVAQFDEAAGTSSNTNTLFLYPHRLNGPVNARPEISFFANDTTPKSPTGAICDATAYNNGGYACESTITVPQAIGGSRAMAFLSLGALYNASDYQIELYSGTTPVNLVAPIVDSTGRANDLFRRVEARINFANEYPRAGIDIEGNLCKNFSVTDNAGDYINTCTP